MAWRKSSFSKRWGAVRAIGRPYSRPILRASSPRSTGNVSLAPGRSIALQGKSAAGVLMTYSLFFGTTTLRHEFLLQGDF